MSDTVNPKFAPRGGKEAVETGTAFQPKFDADGLIPAIVTDASTGDVLMFAWMNEDALAHTIKTRAAYFWSRSRRALWRKGEESGNTLSVIEMFIDCDQDVVWLRVNVEGDGLACHTRQRSCFYRSVPLGTAPTPALQLTSADGKTKAR
jgi:phosphoribosyl-AMP cyclohydrolase